MEENIMTTQIETVIRAMADEYNNGDKTKAAGILRYVEGIVRGIELCGGLDKETIKDLRERLDYAQHIIAPILSAFDIFNNPEDKWHDFDTVEVA